MCGFAMAHILSPITSPGAGNRLAVYPDSLLQAFCGGGEGQSPPTIYLCHLHGSLETIASFFAQLFFLFKGPRHGR